MSTPLEQGESNRGSHNHDRSDSNTSLPMTEVEAHYRSLTEFFRYLVTIVLTGIGVLIGVGLYVTNKDMSAMRAEVRQNTSDVKSELRQSLSDVKADTKTVVDSAKEDAKTAVASTIEGANFAIKGTQNAAEAQISQNTGAICHHRTE